MAAVVGALVDDVDERGGPIDELVVVARSEVDVGAAVFFVVDPVPHPATRPTKAMAMTAFTRGDFMRACFFCIGAFSQRWS